MKLAGLCTVLVAAVVAFSLASTDAPRSVPPRPTAAQPPAVAAPVRVAVFLDLTASAGTARIAVSLDDLAPLFDRLRSAGGEIGFGLIREDSNRPLIRCLVPPPPAPPAPPQRTTGNVFVAVNAQRRDETERSTYEARRRAWDAEANGRIATFSNAVGPFLAAPADAPVTDVTAALARGDLMLAEPTPFASAPPTIVLITDGVHNATPTIMPKLRSTARVVVVNGIGSLGVLDSMTPAPLCFESAAAAVRYIANEGDAHVQ